MAREHYNYNKLGMLIWWTRVEYMRWTGIEHAGGVTVYVPIEFNLRILAIATICSIRKIVTHS